MKKAIIYLRFSSDDQSQHSIERQKMVTSGWANYNKIEIVDTFKDEGISARTFDRPDMKLLMAFVRKNYRSIDYLVVSELTRFSREVGDAINLLKEIQKLYGISIVSASRSCIYDVYDSNSFFMMGLEFLLGNSENIKRQNDINGGIYTAKAIKGRYIGSRAPFGYLKEGNAENRMLIPDKDKATIISYIYDAYLRSTPIYIIKKHAEEMGLHKGDKMSIQKILSNPLYSGQIYVKSWKENPGGIFPAKHEAIVDMLSWQRVQEKMKREDKPRVTIEDKMPLRGVLKCHCGYLLTGAPSRGKSGKYFYYYKCNQAKHNNISAIKSHYQLNEILKHLSLPERMVDAIIEKSASQLQEKLHGNVSELKKKKTELQQTETQLVSVEEKWINDQLSHESYQRWHQELNQKRLYLRSQVDALGKDHDQVFLLMEKNLMKLSKLDAMYEIAPTLQKQELLRMVFDSCLAYKQGIYRTPYIMPIFTHNLLILKSKNLLIYDGILQKPAQVEPGRVELPSKHIRRKLSTCLFPYCLSALHRKRTNQCKA